MAELKLAPATIERDESQSLTPGKRPAPMGEILRTDGELIPRHDIDALKDGLQWLRRERDAVMATVQPKLKCLDILECQILEAIREHARGTTKTQRLVGNNGSQLKVELPSDGWDKEKVIAIWTDPDFSELRARVECMKINEIGVVLKEWKKIRDVTDPPPLLKRFIDRMLAAVKKANSMPKVTIEDPAKDSIDVQSKPASDEIDLSDL